MCCITYLDTHTACVSLTQVTPPPATQCSERSKKVQSDGMEEAALATACDRVPATATYMCCITTHCMTDGESYASRPPIEKKGKRFEESRILRASMILA
jgi:hypothetical protein